MKRLATVLVLVLALCCTQLLAPSPARALYVLGYGDSIAITVKDAPQYAFAGAIRPDGAVTVPFLGDVEVVGLTPGQVSERITKVLSASLRKPEVSVLVTGFRSRTVTLFGQVMRTGNIGLAPGNQTLIDALAAAGGFTDRAVKSQVQVVRGIGPQAQKFVINVEEMTKTGDFSNNIELENGDKIQVPEVWYPDVQKVASGFSLAVSLIGSVAILLSLYDRASRPTQ